MRAFLLLFLLGLGLPIGCGRVDFALAGMERVGDAPTAGDDGAGPDGALAGCTGAFADPMLIPELVSGQSEATFRLTADELTGVLWSTRGGVIDLYLAERPDRATPFALSALTTLNSTANEFDPSIAADGSLIVFASGRPGGDGGLDLYESIVNNNSFAAPVRLATLGSSADDHQPYLRGLGELYFVSTRTGLPRIYRATRTGPGAYQAPTLVSEIGGAEESDPVPTADGLTLYWSSTRGGDAGNVYRATRASLSDPFADVVELGGLTSTSIDAPSWISVDGCRLYMSSDRSGQPHVYLATSP
ncbi:MAG: PD40 domain-containing protein [Kofleriaceae bacterium]|nr:PD40 domain-containing protein [Kofleriaceae bacterium]MBP6838930.1 PD40 domain-containing protein [Kofleriaceae bacterium]MBP9205763.1 PD40 domain-containing protein [Kofleriaceae bacterium]